MTYLQWPERPQGPYFVKVLLLLESEARILHLSSYKLTFFLENVQSFIDFLLVLKAVVTAMYEMTKIIKSFLSSLMKNEILINIYLTWLTFSFTPAFALSNRDYKTYYKVTNKMS